MRFVRTRGCTFNLKTFGFNVFCLRKKKVGRAKQTIPYVDYNRKTSYFWHLLGRTDLDCRSVTSRQPSLKLKCLPVSPPSLLKFKKHCCSWGSLFSLFFPLPNLLALEVRLQLCISLKPRLGCRFQRSWKHQTSLLGLELHCTSKLYGEIFQGNSVSHFIHVSISIKGHIFKIIWFFTEAQGPSIWKWRILISFKCLKTTDLVQFFHYTMMIINRKLRPDTEVLTSCPQCSFPYECAQCISVRIIER